MRHNTPNNAHRIRPCLMLGSSFHPTKCYAVAAERQSSPALSSVRYSARLCENSLFRKCASTKSICYPAKNVEIWGFHTIWRFVRLGLPI